MQHKFRAALSTQSLLGIEPKAVFLAHCREKYDKAESCKNIILTRSPKSGRCLPAFAAPLIPDNLG